jgi:hypothetical protein
MGVLTLGVLGVAMLIPIGKFAMTETEKSDRTGACGRAGLRDVKVRRMLDPNNWWPAPDITVANIYVVDPLGYAKIGSTAFGGSGGVPRVSLQTYTGSSVTLSQSQAEAIFYWHDDLTYAAAKETKNPSNGDRPMPALSGGTQQSSDSFSWFFTVVPSTADVNASVPWSQRRRFLVSVVVCWKRTLDTSGETLIQTVTPDSNIGYGGIGISYPTSLSTVMPKENQWVWLSSFHGPAWYRVVAAGNDGSTIRVSLVGPDWNNVPDSGGTPPDVSLTIVPGVTGVYSRTIQIDDDATWSR